ncbi:DNA methyltransferase [Mediterraneibacter gnavus]|uniref:DNA methyltransferase n=1 Tax=Mediterraneibacter gnavus TaxID=33038 RepID=UPI0011CA8FFE|nr:DNA methyltransferase [uncultured Blautia sp.]
MTDTEQREAVRQFVNRWMGKGKEDEDGRSYWIDLLSNVIGMDNVIERLNFEKKVVVEGNTKRIDVYIPETHVIVEQKSLGKALDQKIHNSGDIDLTPYEQAKRYNDNLPYDEKARWIVTCNFSDIWIYDMNAKIPEPIKIALEELPSKYPLLDFLAKKDIKKISHEMEVSIKAGEIVGLIYDAFYKQYRISEAKEKDETVEQKERREHKLKSLNALCVRLVFCLYAEDAGIFGKRNMFHDYLEAYDIKDCRRAIIELFKILDTPVPERDEYLEEDLAQFPYVNGGLFADETIEVPPFTEEIKQLLLTKASEDFNWRDISPTIFGAVFESTLNPETRRSGGMHYTSIENIHKVIDSLFLDELKNEFQKILQIQVRRTKDKRLDEFQNKLAGLTFLDPACGSGNFLTETYLSLRRLENEVIQEKVNGQITLGEVRNPIKVSIQQFYGIEINDFAVTVAKTALWIAESQMLEETKSIVYGFNDDFLPLKTYVNITEGNALQIDWKDVIAPERLSYIMGNPPFVGTKLMNKKQKEDVKRVLGKYNNYGTLDYVSCWYAKSCEYIEGTAICCAFVSTNSIVQGEQVAPLWKELFAREIEINFAYRTFVWDSEANAKAQVHCVIIGFSRKEVKHRKIIYDGEELKIVNHINAYLVDAEDVFVESKRKPICNVQEMYLGCDFKDDNNYILGEEEKEELIKREPLVEKYIKKYINAKELISRKHRYCLWLNNANPGDLKKLPTVMKKIEAVKLFRLESNSPDTQRYAEYPTRPARLRYYSEERNTSALGVPRISSATRRYLPMELLDADTIGGASILMIPEATLYTFAILNSNVHMAWMRTVCGRMKSDYRYANGLVYNTFPWPSPTDVQKAKIEKAAKGILDARALYPNANLAALYDPLTMPSELSKAHNINNKVVMEAYGFSTKMTEADCVAELMKLYQKLTQEK